ncbi:MAG: hypothetical protein KA354_14200 [Phycisphaerae bacterium]|nr:hypothetical protein [Phycisphaerae bacterium]
MNTQAGLALLVVVFAAGSAPTRAEDSPVVWSRGPHLLLDETLIAEEKGLRREVQHPSRLPDPVVTSFEDGCFQPWVTVVRDPQTKRFRMWYNVPASPGNAIESSLAYIESEDGIHWIRPHRILKTPPIQFGVSVIDEGLRCSDPSRRFKLAWWKGGGLRVAASPDGIAWAPLAEGVVLPTNHDITAIDWDPVRGRYMALLSIQPDGGPFKGLRMPHQSVSTDLVNWRRPPWQIVAPDAKAAIEKGETQFYGMSAVVARGDLLVGMVKVLRDDLNCEPGKKAAELHDPQRPFAGLGYTVLAWSRDGEHWKRETEPFLDRNPQPGTWDRAMAWGDDQIIVGDFTYVYYGGYRWGHKAERFTERQIGFAQMPRDRYVGFTAGEKAGRLRTRAAALQSSEMTVNARVKADSGELKVRVLDQAGRPLAGFDWDDCLPIRGDRVDHPVVWKSRARLPGDKPVHVDFELKEATLYSFDLK